MTGTERTELLIQRVTETRRQVLLAADTLREANKHLMSLTRELQAEIEKQGETDDRTA